MAAARGTTPLDTIAVPASAEAAAHQLISKADCCVICLEPVSDRAVVAPCNHCNFDFACVAGWIEQRPSCPLCNAAVDSVEYNWRDADDYDVYRVDQKPQITTENRQRTSRPLWLMHRPRRRLINPVSRPRVADDELLALSNRRVVYRYNLWALHTGSNRLSRFRDFGPKEFLRSSDLQTRARAWARREIQVFDLTEGTAEFVLSYIVAIIQSIDLRAADGEAARRLGEFLGSEDMAAHFWHEMLSFLRSPFRTVQEWDARVQYSKPLQPERHTDREVGTKRRRIDR